LSKLEISICGQYWLNSSQSNVNQVFVMPSFTMCNFSARINVTVSI